MQAAATLFYVLGHYVSAEEAVIPECLMLGCLTDMPGIVWHHTVARSAAGTGGETRWRGDAPPAPHVSPAHQPFAGGRTQPLVL